MDKLMRYPLVIRWLHRIIALAIMFMIVLGWYLSTMEYDHPDYGVLRQLHRTVGLGLFPLGIAHLLAYAYLPRPALSAGLKQWERLLARLVHMFLLYVVIAIPVAGYLMSGDSLVILGEISVPALFDLPKDIRKVIFGLHELLAWMTAAAVGLHAAAALKHHFIDKDDTLKKML
jgi:cytochrome b561